jgi:flavin-dependent dehydrogenase
MSSTTPTDPRPSPKGPGLGSRPLGKSYDVVILGGGMAGLSLARHLLLDTDKTVLLLERKEEIPGPRQKVGESMVQLAGYYFSKVLDLEEHLLDAHYMKYNLRFYWKTPGRSNDAVEDYSQSFIRNFSNVASYQVDRNRLEAEMLRRNLEHPRFTFAAPARDITLELGEDEAPHTLELSLGAPQGDDGDATGGSGGARHTVRARWVVDSTGRARLLARRMGLRRTNSIRHASFFWWVEGRVNVDRLTGLTRRENRLRRDRADLGHLPPWPATVHFVDEGLWFWVIPLRGKTSLGLVFDPEVVDPKDVMSVEKATEWVCRRFPLLARDLPQREVLDSSGFRSFSYDCAHTLSSERWAMSGEAGRFSDPLYSPGSDLIAIHNTLIVDAIRAEDPERRAARCRTYEALLKAVYQAYMPSYSPGYTALGDPEIFALKYAWELAVYFAAYVFPFINDLFTDRRFVPAFLRFFAALGPLNRRLQELFVAWFRWKEETGRRAREPAVPTHLDFTEITPLARAEKTFYKVGLTAGEAKTVLKEQLESLRELARFAVAHVAAQVAGDPELALRRRFVEALDPEELSWDPEGWRELAAACEAEEEALAGKEPGKEPERWPWTLDPRVLERYHGSAGEEPPEEPTTATSPVLEEMTS